MSYTNFAAFISVKYIQDNFPGAINIPAEDINYGIKTAQEKHIVRALGSNLYNDITTAIFALKNNGTAINSQYVYLRDNYIAPTLLHYAIAELIPTHYTKLCTIGVQQRSSEFSTSPDKAIVAQLINNIKNTADFYYDRLLDHLCNSPSLYPKFLQTESGTDIITPKENNMIGGLYLQ